MSKSKKLASPHDLPQLSVEEAQKAYDRARIAKKLHGPEDLRAAWARRRVGVGELLRILRQGVNSPEIDKPEQTAAYLARLLEVAVDRFDVLVQEGVMDEVLPRLTALPFLYSLKAGTGVREWERASALFKEKKVGTKSVSAHMGSSPAGTRNPIWGMLAAEAAQIASMAAVKLPDFDNYKAQAKAIGHKKVKRPGAHHGWEASIYLLADDGVLIWPDWLEACRELPLSVKDNVEGYQNACRLILKGFFGDPENKWSDEIIQRQNQVIETKVAGRTVKSENKISSLARNEAVRTVVAAVGRLWV